MVKTIVHISHDASLYVNTKHGIKEMQYDEAEGRYYEVINGEAMAKATLDPLAATGEKRITGIDVSRGEDDTVAVTGRVDNGKLTIEQIIKEAHDRVSGMVYFDEVGSITPDVFKVIDGTCEDLDKEKGPARIASAGPSFLTGR